MDRVRDMATMVVVLFSAIASGIVVALKVLPLLVDATGCHASVETAFCQGFNYVFALSTAITLNILVVLILAAVLVSLALCLCYAKEAIKQFAV